MRIRDFREEDRAEYLKMAQIFYGSDAVSHPVDPQHFIRTFDQALAGNPFLRGFIVDLDGQCAGFGLISFTWSNEAGGLVVWLEELYIKPEFRNLKLGTQFMQAVMQEYSESARRFRLEVSRENTAAKRLYERLGFEVLDYIQMISDHPGEL